MARGWHGLKIGDRIRYKLINGSVEGAVVHLSVMNKNSGVMITDDGDRVEIICERCERI